MSNLICIDRKDGTASSLHIIDLILSNSHHLCQDFAHVLLEDRMKVQRLLENHANVVDFVRAVLSTWLDAANCTWDILIDAMERAGLDRCTVNTIRETVQ